MERAPVPELGSVGCTPPSPNDLGTWGHVPSPLSLLSTYV